MTFYEIGDKGNPAVLLIHGMGCNSERSFSKPAKALSKISLFIGTKQVSGVAVINV